MSANGAKPVARSDCWADLDNIPWLWVQRYVTTGIADSRTFRRAERVLAHGSSSIRLWFDYATWMIRLALDLEETRPTLLQDLAGKFGSLYESAGLLAVRYDDLSAFEAKADAFEPPDGFEAQYKDRPITVRDQQWNSFALILRLAENNSRKLTWDSMKWMEVDA